ncbi:MAG: endonuclease/exonuclease/phosphatase family protein, partial [Candidatus Heimdallarchaeota archaeon]|nr:endonuclease/exonuclease/phosphatase family protein [Candidatus Heimdallarchaeota archaeon]
SGVGLSRGLAETTGLSIATYNMFNLFDDYYVEDDLAKHALAIHDYLREPDLIAVQEVEKLDLLLRLANTEPLKGDYEAVLIEGPDARGIDVGLLYNKNRVKILSVEVRQTLTTLLDGYGPGDSQLFSRPPLVVHLETIEKKGAGSDIWLIINHFKSKSVYAPFYADTTPRRIEQAEWVSSLVGEIQDVDPNARVMVLGDLNDFEYSEPLQVLEAAGLNNLILDIDKEYRYTYIYRGYSQVLDHMLVTPSLIGLINEVRIMHFNVDYPFTLYGYDSTIGICSSDHEVLMASIQL